MFQTQRSSLKLIQIADFEEVLGMFREPDTFKYIGPLQNKSDEEYRDFLYLKCTQIQEGVGYYWVGRTLQSQEFIGSINLNPFRESGQMQIGFQIRRRFWNQGYAYEMSQPILEYALKELRLKTIYGFFEKENIASGKILQKLGFQFHERKQFDPADAELEVYRILND